MLKVAAGLHLSSPQRAMEYRYNPFVTHVLLVLVQVVLVLRPLIEKAFSEYNLIDLTSFYTFPSIIKVEEGEEEQVEVGTLGRFFYPLKNSELKKIKITYNLPQTLEAPVNKGEAIGEVQIFIDNDLLFSEKIYTISQVRRNSIWQKLKDLIEQW